MGNQYYAIGVANVIGTIRGNYDPASVNRRLKSWGFDMLSLNASYGSWPGTTDSRFPFDSNGIQSQPVKMPFLTSVRPALYAMHNTQIGAAPYLVNPVKDIIQAYPPTYTGYVSPGGVADYYDSGIGTWLTSYLTSGDDSFWAAFPTSPYKGYLIGLLTDDGDQLNGFSAGPDFATNPAGYNNNNFGMQVATFSPLMTAINQYNFQFVYADTLVHTRIAQRNQLAAEYTTIGAMNTAWSSTYTTFDSSGVCVGTQPITCASSVSADSVGTGNGSTVTFTTTLSHTTVSWFSLQILVAGVAVAGDVRGGTLYGPTVTSGAINYTTGALSITFATAPANGAAITATYVANGWGIGSGFLDEDNRASHTWTGTDWVQLSNANANFKTDMNTFLQQAAHQYFSTCRTNIKALFPNLMYLGPDAINSYNVPPPAPVLKGAVGLIDAYFTGNTNPFTLAEMDYIESNGGNVPYFGSFYSAANPDSAMSAYPQQAGSGSFLTQAARGAAYLSTMIAQLQTAHTTAGNYPYIGMSFFGYVDITAERLDWGLTTPSDNAYDGHEAGTASVPCSVPIQTYTCGGEAGNYGDVITSIKAANSIWLTLNP
jgi:hypothetical protein